jgi:hypothetical protein
MTIDRVNAVFVGRVKDEHGFPAQLLEEPGTGRRYLAYDPDTWWERGRYLSIVGKSKQRASVNRIRTLKERRHAKR